MEKFTNLLKAFGRDDSGASMIEYAVLVVLVALVGGGVLVLIGDEIDTGFNAVLTMLQNANSGT